MFTVHTKIFFNLVFDTTFVWGYKYYTYFIFYTNQVRLAARKLKTTNNLGQSEYSILVSGVLVVFLFIFKTKIT